MNVFGYMNSYFKPTYTPLSFGSNSSIPLNWPYCTEEMKNDKNNPEIFFFNQLVRHMPATDYIPTGEKENILLIGCGSGLEAEPIAAYFGGEANYKASPKREVKVCGLDLGKVREINRAKTMYPSEKYPYLHFYEADATKDEAYSNPEVSEKVDIVVFNHPLVDESDCYNYKKMIKKSYDKLRTGGLIIFKTFYQHEMSALKEHLEVLRDRGGLKLSNKIYEELPYKPGNGGTPDYLLIVKKEV